MELAGGEPCTEATMTFLMPDNWDGIPEHMWGADGNIYSIAELRRLAKEDRAQNEVLKEIIDKLIEKNHVAADFIQNHMLS
jgi:hypothetical protein